MNPTAGEPIHAVLFDADQTLWDFQLVMHHALEAVLVELRQARPGSATSAATVRDLVADRTAVMVEHPGELDLTVLRRFGFARTLSRLGLSDGGLAQQLTDSYFCHRDAEPELFADTVPCLDALQGHYRLGVLSNGSRLPERCGLEGRFEVTVFAQHHGVAKPDRALFERTAGLIGVPAANCLLVGDHPVNDVAGAKGAGWRAVWIDRESNGTWDPDVPGLGNAVPDAIVTSLEQLPAALGAL